MSYGPESTLAEISSDEVAASILRRHLPGVFEILDVQMVPFLTLDELPLRIRAAGEPAPNLTPVWQELAALPNRPSPKAARHAPGPPAPDYESATVPRASAQVSAASA